MLYYKQLVLETNTRLPQHWFSARRSLWIPRVNVYNNGIHGDFELRGIMFDTCLYS